MNKKARTKAPNILRRLTTLGRPAAWLYADALVLLLSLGWFTYNATLPDMYKGRICCDSVNYIDLAKEIDSIQDVLQNYGWRTNGYPVFLKANQLLVESVLGLPVDFVYVSLIVTFLLHLGAAWFFFSSLKQAGFPVQRLLLWLLWLHPGLVSHTAVPLTDGFVTTLIMFAAGSVLRLTALLNGAQWWVGREVAWSALTGVLFAWAVLVRPAHLPAAILTMGAVTAVTVFFGIKRRNVSAVLVTVACPLLFAVVLAPRTLACMRFDHRLCLYAEADRDAFLRTGLDIQRPGPRTYSVNWTDEAGEYHAFVRTVEDEFFLEHFACLREGEPPLRRAIECYKRNMPHMPLFFLKKTISLFDNFHLNSYAAWITRPWHIVWNRAFGLAGFIGFGTLFILLGAGAWKRRMTHNVAVFLYPLLYWVTSLIPSTDSRYGFPLVPFSLAALCASVSLVRGKKARRALYVAWLLLAIVFLLQTTLWDLSDPLVLGNQE